MITPQSTPPLVSDSAKILRRYGLAIETIPFSRERRSRDGIPSAVGNYANFLSTEYVVVAPVYGNARDQTALDKLTDLISRTCRWFRSTARNWPGMGAF